MSVVKCPDCGRLVATSFAMHECKPKGGYRNDLHRLMCQPDSFFKAKPSAKSSCISMHEEAKMYLSDIGRKGGQKSRRKLTKAQARAMVRARTAKRAALRQNDQAQRRGHAAADARTNPKP